MPSWKIALADEHLMFAEGLTAVFTDAGHVVVGVETSWPALADVVRRTGPDLCVMDVNLSGGKLAENIAALRELSPNTSMVVLTTDSDPEQLQTALRAGVAAFVHKTRGLPALLDTFSRVAAGEVVIEGSFARPNASDTASAKLAELASYLTPREKECLQLLTEGRATVAIAAALGVSRTTVRTHVQAVLTKLGAHSRLEAAALATRYGLVEPAQPAAQHWGSWAAHLDVG
jgi:DNA-binding NarL/FixJ family response regulator